MKRLLGALALLSVTAGTVVWAQTNKAPATTAGKQASIEERRRYYTEDVVAPMIRPAKYDVTIVEYMDYQCPYCRATHGPLKQLLAKDHKIRVIFRDWPIFGPASEKGALIALGSKYQGKYVAVHNALMETPLPLNDEKIKGAVKRAGANWEQIQKDLKAHSQEIKNLLQRNDEQAQRIGLEGTPGFIIGNVESFGGMTLAQLEKAVARARQDAAGKA